MNDNLGHFLVSQKRRPLNPWSRKKADVMGLRNSPRGVKPPHHPQDFSLNHPRSLHQQQRNMDVLNFSLVVLLFCHLRSEANANLRERWRERERPHKIAGEVETLGGEWSFWFSGLVVFGMGEGRRVKRMWGGEWRREIPALALAHGSHSFFVLSAVQVSFVVNATPPDSL